MKNKVNYKLINMLVGLGIFTLVYMTAEFWLGLLSIIVEILMPFLIAFSMAYAMFPVHRFLVSKKVPKPVSILIIVAAIGLILWGLIGSIIPLIVSQSTNLFNNIIQFLQDLNTNYNLDVGSLESTLKTNFDAIMSNVGSHITNGAVSLINASIGFISAAVIIFILSIYFLGDMQSIRTRVSKYLKNHNKKQFQYLKKLDTEMNHYLRGFSTYVGIQIVEYTTVYALIGHPNFLLIGLLSGISAIIPYFGGIAVNVIALITASVISTKLFVLTLIITLILPNVDGYIISPKVFGKTNQLNPMLTIFAVFAGGVLAGFIGIVIAVPLTIIIQATIKFYREDISELISDIKEKID